MGIILTISTVAGFVLLILTCCFLKYNPEYLDKYHFNWYLNPINNIQVTNDNECPKGTEPLINSVFYGYIDYCNCSNSTSNKYKGKVYSDVCEEEQGKSKCKTVIEQKTMNITKWRGKTICVGKMIGDLTDFIQKKIPDDNTCNSKGKMDSEGNNFCSKSFEGHPLNYLQILKKDAPPGVNCVNLDDEYKICYSNNITNGSIIVQVEISQDKNGICASYDEGRFSENEFEFNRMKGSSTCNTSIAGKLYDYRFYPLDNHSYKYKDLLKENNITKYDYLNITDSSEVKLYYTNYFGLKKECYGEVSIKDLLDKKITAVQVLCIISCVFGGFLAIFCVICSIIDEWQDDTEGIHKFFSGLIAILTIIAEIVLFIKGSWYQTFRGNECFDQITFENFWKMYWHIWISKLFLGILIGIYCLNLCYPQTMGELF